jgi:hypothetical protein
MVELLVFDEASMKRRANVDDDLRAPIRSRRQAWPMVSRD